MESPFAVVRLRTTAARRHKRVQCATAMIWNAYPEDIKGWINARGGLQRDFHWMRAPDTYRYFKRC